MATTAQRIIIDTEAGRLLGSFGGLTGVTNPNFILGDSCPLEIYLAGQQGIGGVMAPVPFPAGATIRVAVGLVNTQPTSGDWSLEYDGDETDPLAYDVSAATLQTELNALASVTSAGGLTVSQVGTQYRIAWNTTGAKDPFATGANTLVPASTPQVQTLQEGDATTKEVVLLNLAVNPIGLTDTFTDTPAPVGSYSPTGYSLTGLVRGGSYKLEFSWEQDGDSYTTQTDSILSSANTQQISQAIFNALVNDGWGQITGNATTNAWGVNATQLDAGKWRLDFTAPQFTTAVTVVAPTVTDIITTDLEGYAGKVGVLGFNTVEAVAFLGNEASRNAILEVEIEDADGVQTLLQAPCTLEGQVIAGGVYASIPVSTPLTEAVANNRFLRRDADQTLDTTSKNQLWENLTGVTSPTGVDLVAALTGAALPSASNVFATISDLSANNPFDQDLNTTDSVEFNLVGFSNATSIAKGTFDNGMGGSNGISLNCAVGYELNWQAGRLCSTTNAGVTKTDIFLDSKLNFDGDSTLGIVFGDSTTQTTAAVFFDQDLNTTDSATFLGLTTTGGDVTLNDNATPTSTYQFKWDASTAIAGYYGGAVPVVEITSNGIVFGAIGATLTFSDSTVQESAPVYSAATSIHSGGGGHIDANDYPDEIRIVIGGVTYAMPARTI